MSNLKPTILVAGSQSTCQMEDDQRICCHDKNNELQPNWFNICYSKRLPNVLIRHGFYQIGCGGSCDWFITPNNLNDKSYITLPYENQQKLYVFNFFRQHNYLTTPMGLILKQCLSSGQLYFISNHDEQNKCLLDVTDFPTDQPNFPTSKDYGIDFIFLSNQSILNYNETEMCLQSYIDDGIDCDDLGGQLFFSNLF